MKFIDFDELRKMFKNAKFSSFPTLKCCLNVAGSCFMVISNTWVFAFDIAVGYNAISEILGTSFKNHGNVKDNFIKTSLTVISIYMNAINKSIPAMSLLPHYTYVFVEKINDQETININEFIENNVNDDVNLSGLFLLTLLYGFKLYRSVKKIPKLYKKNQKS